jgi:hypothetical protein
VEDQPGDAVALRRVELRRTPARLLVRSHIYNDELLRELELVQMGATPANAHGEALEVLATLEQLLVANADVNLANRLVAEEALRRGELTCDVVLQLPALAADFADVYLALFGQVCDYTERGLLLTLPPAPEVAAFQRAWLAEIARQLREPDAPPRAQDYLLTLPNADLEPGTVAGPRPSGDASAMAGAERVRGAFAPELVAAPRARRLVTTALARWDARDLGDVAALATSELVTNAVLHARTRVEVMLAFDGATLRVEVRDDVATLPNPRGVNLRAGTGRGLALVAAVAARWGAEQTDTGKVVWFEADRAAS